MRKHFSVEFIQEMELLKLVKRDIKAMKCHGQLSDAIKVLNQAKWTSDEVKVMVANSSFGMGVDKGNARYVIHAKPSTSVKEYFRQCG